MDVDMYLKLAQAGIEVAVLVSAPILLLGLAAGLFVSIFQAATQINDSSLAFIPKIAAAVAGLVFFGHFMLNRIATFTTWTFSLIANLSP